MSESTKRAILDKTGLVINELRGAILKYTTNAVQEANSNGLGLHRALGHLQEVLAPKAEEEVRQYCLDLGVRDAEAIAEGLSTALLPSLSAFGPSLAATFQGGMSAGSSTRWAQDVQSWAQGYVNGIPARTRVAVEKQRHLDPPRSRVARKKQDSKPAPRVQGANPNGGNSVVTLFVSHSARDAQIVEPLVVLLRSALCLSAAEIRCTSVNGYRLPAGADTNEQLRREVNDSAVLLGVISTESLRSLYVIFELGARWGTKKTFVPLLAPGAPTSLLGGPLAGINALRLDVEAQVHQLLDDVGRYLDRKVESPAVYKRELDAFLQRAEARQREVITANLHPSRASAGAAAASIEEAEGELTIPIGLQSYYLATEPDGDTCIQLDCRILVCASEMSQMRELLPILEQVARAKQPLFIAARSVGAEVLATLITNTQKGILRACVVCTGASSDPRRIERLIAQRTSTCVFHDDAGRSLEMATLDQLGHAKKVEARTTTTRIVLR
jgi:hypothetical protein